MHHTSRRVTPAGDRKALQDLAVQTPPLSISRHISSEILTISYNISGALFHVSDSYARYFGCAPEELLGKNMAWCIRSGDIGTVLRLVSSLSAHSPSRIIIHGVIRPDGSEARQLWLHTATFPGEVEVVCYQAAGLELDPNQADVSAAEAALRRHLLGMENTVVDSGESTTRFLAP
ncbi:MAG: hypothetical protein ACOCWR_01900 [Oceanidesulfovibrio sp.]